MIEVRYKARLGNNLFQYALGRILASELGFELRADPIVGFPNTEETIRGKCFANPTEFLTGQTIDLSAILAEDRPRHIVLDGWFQNWRYYRAYRNQIRTWFAFDPTLKIPEEPIDLVVNVRRTDYVQLGWALPFSYYEEAISRLLPEGGRLGIVTDDMYDPFFWAFRRWRPKFLVGNPIEQLAIMVHAKRLVMSQSTFSWWATFLAPEGQMVVSPLPSYGCWALNTSDEKADLIESDRFYCIPCVESYQGSLTERTYQQWRLIKRRGILHVNRKYNLSIDVPPG
jgi:hypothetical protein